MFWCRWKTHFAWLALVIFAGTLSHASVLEGFWHKDPKWQRRANLQRKIYVSARTEKIDKKHTMKVEAMGLVAVPLSFATEKAKHYRELPKVSGHFKSAEFRKETNQLFLVTEAFRWQARMLMQFHYSTEESGTETHAFEVIGGSFKGLKGKFTFAAFEPDRTQLVLSASYSDETLPLPKILMGMALEVIVEQVAQKMRAQMERAYKNQPVPEPLGQEKP